jgi:hypothetical protein
MKRKRISKHRIRQSIEKLTRRQFMVAGVLLLIFALLGGSAMYYRIEYVREYVRARTVAQALYPLQTWQTGEIVSNSAFAFRLNSAREDTHDIPHFWELVPGQKYVMVNLTFKNTSQETYHLSPIRTMQLRDASGTLYQVTSAPYIQDSLGGPVAPGQTVSGEVGFTVPAAAKDINFIFEPHVLNAHTIVVKCKVGNP